MERLAGVLVRRSRRVLAVTALLTLAALAMLPRIAFDADVTSFLTDSNEEGRAFAALQERFGVGDPIMVLLERSDGAPIDDRAGMVLIAEARQALDAVPQVGSVGSFLPPRLPLGNAPLSPSLLRTLPAGLLDTIRDGPGAELLLSDDGEATLLVVQIEGDPIAAARAVLDEPLPDGLTASYAGNPIVYAEVVDLLGWFLLAIPPAVFVLLMLVFAATLGGPRPAALAMLPAILGTVWTFGVLFALGIRVDLITVIVPVFVIVLGSADGLHFVAHLQAAAARGMDREAQTVSALREVGVPMILTTISTGAGFLSLMATGVGPIAQLGLFVSIGIAFAGVISLTTLPALMSRLSLSRPGSAATAHAGIAIDRAVLWAARRRWTAVALVLPAIVFAALFVPRLSVDSDPLFFFPHGHPVRIAFDRVEDAFGGATPLFGEFVVDPDRPLDQQLGDMRKASAGLEHLPGIRTVFSLAALLPELPEAQREAVLAGDVTLPFGRMLREDGMLFVAFPGAYEAADVARWRAAARDADVIRNLSGSPMLFEALAAQIARAQAGSLGVAFLLVTILLALAYRRLGRALLALAPITVTVAVVVGFLAASGIGLNLITVVASSIVLGVGIDYAIHLVAALEHARRARPPFGSVAAAIRAAARPIVGNAVGIAIGLSALQLSPLRPHHQISALMWVGMVVAMLATLTIVPAREPRAAVRDDDAA